MRGAPTAAVAVAQAVAAAAGTFQCRSRDLGSLYPGAPLAQFAAALPYAVLPVAGGLPVEEDGQVVAGLGVAGRDPGACEDIAAARDASPGGHGPLARHVERLCDQSKKLIMVAGKVQDREDAPCLS
jgi:uncharacterized protein GlcG (DUF336 family)